MDSILDKSIISKLNFLNCIVVMKRNGGRGVTGHGICNSFLNVQQKEEVEKKEKNKHGKMLAFAKTEVKDIIMG